ncbi:hypothetical protein ACSBR2_021922 [Camellia fascicularis]
MEKAIKSKVTKAVVPAIDVMFQALRFHLTLVLIATVCCWMMFAVTLLHINLSK